jgi:hypothetical protein
MREVRTLIDIEKAFKQKVANFGTIRIEGGSVFYKDEEVHGQLSTRILQMLDNGQDPRAWALFMENLMKNPAKHAVDELFLWLERSGMPITERGNFLAYKKVQDDYTSYHVAKNGQPFRNDIGTFCSMDRNKVDDNRAVTCSAGLHFCSWDYLPHYMGGRGRVVIVEVNPAHVVSIPNDYNNAKGRAEGYLVVGEIPEDQAPHAFQDVAYAGYDDSDWITFDQDDDVDYSTIDEDFYSDSWQDYDSEEAVEDYETGFDEGTRDRIAAKSRNAELALDEFNSANPFLEVAYADSFEDGYNDGWYEKHYNLQLQEALDEVDEEDQLFAEEISRAAHTKLGVVAASVSGLINRNLPAVSNSIGYDAGAGDAYEGIKAPFQAIIDNAVTCEDADQFINDYNEGWDNAQAFMLVS